MNGYRRKQTIFHKINGYRNMQTIFNKFNGYRIGKQSLIK